MPCIVAVDGKIMKFRKINELPKDIVYWTNLDKEYVWKYSRFAHLKDANYLGLSYESIISPTKILQRVSQKNVLSYFLLS